MPYAGFWKRLAAALLDGVILIVAGGFVGALLGSVDESTADLAGLVIGWLYFALFESSAKQATPGKMALGIVVTDLYGNRISFARATGRHFGKILSSVILFIGFLMVAFTAKKQGLHDMLAGCLVVTAPPASPKPDFSSGNEGPLGPGST